VFIAMGRDLGDLRRAVDGPNAGSTTDRAETANAWSREVTGKRKDSRGSSQECRPVRKRNYLDGRHHARVAAGGFAQVGGPQGGSDGDCDLPGGARAKRSACSHGGGPFSVTTTLGTKLPRSPSSPLRDDSPKRY